MATGTSKRIIHEMNNRRTRLNEQLKKREGKGQDKNSKWEGRSESYLADLGEGQSGRLDDLITSVALEVKGNGDDELSEGGGVDVLGGGLKRK